MINIFENTLLKWIFRQGNDIDRKNITLDSGEPGYTIDTKRLWVGDGVTTGGILVGNIFKGSNVNITTLAPCEIGDFAYNTSSKKLFRLVSGEGSNISEWEEIGGVYTPLNNTINISNTNQISVNTNALSSITIVPLYGRYDGDANTLLYHKNLNGVNKIGVGHYTFTYNIETANVVPTVQIFGETDLEYVPRILTLTNSSCQVKVQNLSGGTIDTELFFSIIR